MKFRDCSSARGRAGQPESPAGDSPAIQAALIRRRFRICFKVLHLVYTDKRMMNNSNNNKDDDSDCRWMWSLEGVAVPFHQTWKFLFFNRLCRWRVVRGLRSFAGVARPKCLRPSARGSRPFWRVGRGLRARCAPHLRAHALAKGLQGCPRAGGHLATPKSRIVATKSSLKIR